MITPSTCFGARTRVEVCAVVAFGLAVSAGCSNSTSGTRPSVGTGGSPSSGGIGPAGTSGVADATGSGGETGSGSQTTGGTSPVLNATGGAPATGGSSAAQSGTGGVPATGGSSAVQSGTGGSPGSSGHVGSGGVPGIGGATSTGGAAGSGGAGPIDASPGSDASVDCDRALGAISGPIKIACVGDSITQANYPADLGLLLGASYKVENDGHSGAMMMRGTGASYWDTPEFERAQSFLPNIVIICLGTNDMNIWNWPNKAAFPGAYAAMIDSFRALSSHPVVYACLPPWVSKDDTKYQYTEARLADGVIPLIVATAREKRACVIDFHAATMNHPEYYADSLHPNELGFTVLAKTAWSVITSP